MRTILLGLLITLVFSANWQVVDSLPTCYTGLPFEFSLGAGYQYYSADIPAWAILDSKNGIITGRHNQAGAWPFTVEVRKGSQQTKKQYILNVVDSGKAEKNMWAGKSQNYYGRKVANPFRIVASKSYPTFVNVGENF